MVLQGKRLMKVLVVGCGYLGERVARRWAAAGHTVHVLTRSTERARTFAERGWNPVVGDVVDQEALKGLPACDVVLFAVGFDRRAPHPKRSVYVNGLENVLRSGAGRSRRWIAISSTSVYGQTGGERVDEDSPCVPAAEGGQICLAAEEQVGAWRDRTGGEASVLRLSGIYGPGRLLARAQQLREGEPLSGRGDAWLNLIHGDDAAEVVCRVAEMAAPPDRLLVTDDRPILRAEYYSQLARLADAPAPRFAAEAAEADLNKRCSNQRLRSLGIALSYPTIDVGLPHAWGETVG